MRTRRVEYLASLTRRIWKFIVIFAAVYVGAAVLFFLTQEGRVDLFDSFYWSMVTLGTVGYGDFVPTNATGKLLAQGLIVTQVFLIGYLVSLIAGAVNEEAQRRALGTYRTSLEGHVVVLGYSPVGAAAVRELLIQEQKVAVVTERSEDIPNLRALAPEDRLYITFGPASSRETLDRLNLAHAHSVIISTADDAANMISALNIRTINPGLRIVVSVGRPELRDTLRAAGVTYIASPSDMGGRMCASAAFEPDVANALEDLTAADVRADFREYALRPGGKLVGRTFAQADQELRAATGCLLIGYARRQADGEYRSFVNPPFDEVLRAEDAVLLLGTIAHTRALTAWFGYDQGR